MSVQVIPPGSDLFMSGAQVIVNPVNCQGAMGKGLAEAFKLRFPENFQAYRSICQQRKLRPGKLFAFDQAAVPSGQGAGSPQWIVNLATKDHWLDPSNIDWVQAGALELRRWAEANQVETIACPALGAGLGQLDWDKVRHAVIGAFQGSDIEVLLYAPHEAGKAHQVTRKVAAPSQEQVGEALSSRPLGFRGRRGIK